MKLLSASAAAAMMLSMATAGLAQDDVAQSLFTNVHVFDGRNEARIENANVLVEGDLIKTVSTDAIDAPDATVIGGGGRTLMPGLIDAHTHLYMNMPGGVGGMEAGTWGEIDWPACGPYGQ